MIYLIFGEENFLVKKEQEKIAGIFLSENPKAIFEKFDVEDEWDFFKIKESLNQGGGLFSSKKLILIKNIDKIKKEEAEALTDFIKNSFSNDSDNFIIFTAGEKVSKKEKVFRLIFSKGKVLEFKKLQGDSLRKWIIGQVNFLDKSIRIDPDAVSQLELIFRKDLWQLGNAINVLVNFCDSGDDRRIKKTDVENLCRGEISVKIFDFVDAIGSRNKSRAIDLFYALINQGENGFYILSMILFQLRNLVKVFSLAKTGQSNSLIISKKLSIHPYVVQKTLGQLKNFSSGSLKKIYQQIADIDYQAKTGEKSIEDGLTDFIAML